MTLPIWALASLRESAIRTVEQISAVVDAIDACGDGYAHFSKHFEEDLEAARAHLGKCEANLAEAVKLDAMTIKGETR